MQTIKLSQGHETIVDNEDFEYLNNYKWSVQKNRKVIYAYRRAKIWWKYKTIYMHSYIMNTPKWMVTDHINLNWLDNRKENLRICTIAQNLRNRGKNINNATWYKGVSFYKKTKKYVVMINILWKDKNLWYFNNKEEAYNKYCEVAKEGHLEFYHP